MRLGVFLVHFFGVVTFFSCHSPSLDCVIKLQLRLQRDLRDRLY